MLAPTWLESDSRQSWYRFLFCCFIVITGCRWFIIERHGVPIGWGDDVDGIADKILGPWHAGTLQWQALFAPHNGDHVITVTRLWEILWFVLNGSQWDPKLVMIAKAPVFATAMVIFIHLLTRGLDRGRFAAAGVLTILFAFPFNYHNLLWAFQSQFDFFLLTAALGWLALLNGRPILALAIAAVSPLTLGAGPVLAASYVPYWIGMRLLARRMAGIPDGPWRAVAAARWPRIAAFCLAAIAIAAIGASLPTPDAMPRTGTLGERAATWVKLYAWPFSNLLSAVERLPESSRLIPGKILNFPSAESSWMLALAGAMHRHPLIVVAINLVTAAVLTAPLMLMAILTLRRRIPFTLALGPLALSGFVGLMLAATAVARAEQPTIAIRFVDYVMLAGFIAIVAGFILAAQQRRWRGWFAAWLVIMGCGYVATAGATLSQMVHHRKARAGLEVLQRHYAGDAVVMRQKENFAIFIMSDDPTAFIAQLDRPQTRAVMPRLTLDPNAAPGPAARAASAIAQWGLAIAGFAAVGAAWLALRRRPLRFAGAPAVTPA